MIEFAYPGVSLVWPNADLLLLCLCSALWPLVGRVYPVALSFGIRHVDLKLSGQVILVVCHKVIGALEVHCRDPGFAGELLHVEIGCFVVDNVHREVTH